MEGSGHGPAAAATSVSPVMVAVVFTVARGWAAGAGAFLFLFFLVVLVELAGHAGSDCGAGDFGTGAETGFAPGAAPTTRFGTVVQVTQDTGGGGSA